MDCKKGLTFLDAEGMTYLITLLKKYIDLGDSDKVAEALDRETIYLDGKVLKVRMANGSYLSIDLSGICTGGSGTGNFETATDDDIDDLF